MTSPAPVTASDSAAVGAAIRVMKKVGWDSARIARELHVRPATISGWLDGSKALPAAKAAEITRSLCGLARHVVWGNTDKGSYADELLAIARQIGPECFAKEYRFAKQEFLHHYGGLSMSAYDRHGRLSCGLHVADFMSETEEYLLLKIGADGRLDQMIGFAPQEEQALSAELPATPRGVRAAPWSSETVMGTVLLAIDSRSRLRAQVDVPANWHTTAFLDAWEDLEAVLDVLDPLDPDETSLEPINRPPSPRARPERNDEYDAGDVWKRGTIYDHTVSPDDRDDGKTR